MESMLSIFTFTGNIASILGNITTQKLAAFKS